MTEEEKGSANDTASSPKDQGFEKKGSFRLFVKNLLVSIKEIKVWYGIGGLSHVLNDFKLAFFENTNRNLIDPLILTLFTILLLSTTLLAGYNILSEIFIAFKEHTDSAVLQLVEHIFLNLLPIFVVSGFFNYYMRSARNLILNANQGYIDDEQSAKPMNFSKILFVSSIISYVVIKIIDTLSTTSTQAIDLTVLISYGALLLMLMLYFFFLHRH
ncbi:MAG TPA: hypothetical protein VGO50_03200 [Pyrinomonadaceae bacterium]|jgi:hypothetical protein|nr:hypothetical protein [Pyrinomonadaceae bacterium]